MSRIFQIIIVLIAAFLLAGIIYDTPLHEEMVCNEWYICNIEHTFLGNIKSKKVIELSRDSILSTLAKRRDVPSRYGKSTYTDIYTYLCITDKQGNQIFPFIYYLEKHLAGAIYYDTPAPDIMTDYKKYMENPTVEFRVETNSSIWWCLGKILAVILVCVYLFCTFESLPNKKNDKIIEDLIKKYDEKASS